MFQNLQSDIFNCYNLSKNQLALYNSYILLLNEWNKKFNLVGKSTLIDPLKSHILDCIQISTFIKNKKANIVDLGTGAGLPGIILVICGYSNVSLIDSNNKKIKFINYVAKNLNLSVNIIHSRIENINNTTFDYIISRALSKLDKLLFYSSLLSHKKTKLLFLKGKNINHEIISAQQKWSFDFNIFNSASDYRGKVLSITKLKKI